MDVDKAVAVGAALLVEDAQRVQQLVDGAALLAQAVGAAGVGRLQRHDLRAAELAHVRPAPARARPRPRPGQRGSALSQRAETDYSPLGELDGPDEEEILGLAVPGGQLDARHKVDGPDGLVDRDVAVRIWKIHNIL